MKTKSKIVFSIFLFGHCMGCDIMDSHAIHIINESQKRKFVIVTIENNFSIYEKSPLETSIEQIINGDTIWKLNLERIEPNRKSVFTDYNWKLTIDESEQKKINIFVFNQSALEHFAWDTLRKKVKSDTLISLSYTDLEKLNWKVYLK